MFHHVKNKIRGLYFNFTGAVMGFCVGKIPNITKKRLFRRIGVYSINYLKFISNNFYHRQLTNASIK